MFLTTLLVVLVAVVVAIVMFMVGAEAFKTVIIREGSFTHRGGRFLVQGDRAPRMRVDKELVVIAVGQAMREGIFDADLARANARNETRRNAS